jgi:hypothetical protein
MVLEIVHNRLVVGLQKEDWTRIFYEPISAPEELITPDLAPDVGLYSHSRGEARDNEPMIGEVAWEPLLNPLFLRSSATNDRRLLQKKLLYDAWRYLVAQNPADIAVIREQLQGSHRQRVLLKELDKARKARTNIIRQKERRRARRAQRLDPDAPAASIEVSDDDSGLGSDTEDNYEEDIDNEDGRRMSPPSRAANRRLHGARRGPVARSSPMMSDGLGDFGSASRNTASSTSQTNATKRKRPAGPGLQRNSHARSESQHLFMTPAATGRPRGPEHDGDDDDEFDVEVGQGTNGGLSYKAAIAAARERSLAPGEDGNVWDGNGGLDFVDAMLAATRASMAPQSGS